MRTSFPAVTLIGLLLTLSCGGKVEETGSPDAGVAGKSQGGSGGYNPGSGGKGGSGWGGSGWGGSGWGGYGGTGLGGTGGWGGTGGSTGQPKLGAKCKQAADCGSTLTCIANPSIEFLGGFPAGGYCTKECTQDASVCDAIGGTCVSMAPDASNEKSYCLKSCDIGPELQVLDGKLDPNKCWGRNTVACTELAGYASVCMPRCQRDADCQAAKCDHKTGMCSLTPHSGLPMGAGCRTWGLSEGDAGQDCEGDCLGVLKTDTGSDTDPNNIAYFCSESCVLNDFTGCGFSESVPAGTCLYMAVGYGAGDQGWCLPMCDVDSDCLDEYENNAFCDTQWLDQGWPRGFCMYKYGPHGTQDY